MARIVRLRTRGLLMITTAIGAVGLTVGPAQAQALAEPQDAPSAAEGASDQDIVVTASRTAQNGLQAPTPTQVIGADVIAKQAVTTVMEVLNQNPAFKATRSPGANATNTSSPAQATADLRALGGQRTLVLVNGSRVVPFAPASNLGVPTTTDLNLFPTLMIERVDVVTGGASALYGSDAVSGVVNLLMRKQYDGIQVTAQAGISSRGDYRTLRGGFIGGHDFDDDRGHIVLSADYSDNNGVGDIYRRGWGRDEWMIVSNGQRTTPNTPGFGQPAFILAKNVHNSLGAGGVITSVIPGLTNMTFNNNGTLRPFQKGSIFGGSTMIGGEGRSIITDTALVPDVTRFTAYGSLHYELSDAVTAYVEGGYSWSEGFLDGVAIRLTSQAIRRDNAFLPPAVLALLPATTQSFNISKIAHDVGINHYDVTNKTPHGVVGFEAALGGAWKLDAHLSYGENHYASRTSENPVTAKLAFAIDAVKDANGNIVCRGVRDGVAAAAGCQPLNLFGEGNTSAAARAYIWGNGLSEVKYTQVSAAANIVGQPFSTWAGPVAVAFGGEYRRETEALTADAVGAANGFLTAGNAVPYSGAFDVKEGYAEVTVPLAADTPGLETLDVNGAFRYADYSTAGGQTAWKLGAVWEPIKGLNFRVARSRDIRAPAINELYSPGSNVTNNVTLVVDGVTKNASIPQNTSLGNPNVGPEFADTWTAGFAYTGSGALRGVGLSVDYYNIKIKDAITNLSTTNIAALCGAGETQFCNYFTYGPDTSTPNPNDRIHTGLVAGALNVGAFTQEGIDMTLSYRTTAPFLGEDGRFTTTASGTYVLHALVDSGTGAAPIDRVGENGWANLGAIPHFRSTMTNTFGAKQWELSLQTIFISGGVQDVTYNTSPTTTINDNKVPRVVYFNLTGKLMVGDARKFELFWAVNNVLDKDPPPTPYIILNGPVNGQYYDKVGRNFMVGARVKF
ncbi:TonB-dependent receptor plug domain-containing protein [Sphingobium nicotianae]|uniref:TonB-dependent receptor n=1 Tax=Sphingobium nicotianae TaxID=2782607 RepID=A0A9X1IRL3_9SPHN|nr:TonB-dependent receptor [Sphingobium nicotianae]MBT2187305.1 TonB-dependent receptor [Sphingobium nicotianae]